MYCEESRRFLWANLGAQGNKNNVVTTEKINLKLHQPQSFPVWNWKVKSGQLVLTKSLMVVRGMEIVSRWKERRAAWRVTSNR
jgi:hypothetical protein